MKNGFTIIETIIVIVILAVLVLVVVPRIGDLGDVRLHMAVHKVAADLKYARDFAMNHGCESQVVIPIPQAPSGPHYYTISENFSGSWNQILKVDMDEGDYAGVSIPYSTLGSGTGNFVQFNLNGIPIDIQDNEPLDSTGVIAMSGGGREAYIYINNVTGAITLYEY